MAIRIQAKAHPKISHKTEPPIFRGRRQALRLAYDRKKGVGHGVFPSPTCSAEPARTPLSADTAGGGDSGIDPPE